MKLVIDSSVFVAAFRPGEPRAREAFHILEQLESGTISAVVPTTVVLEVVAAIRRRTGSAALAQQVGEKLLSFSALSLIDVTAFRLINYLPLATDCGLAGMDVVVVGVAQEFGVPLVTLDQEMAKRAQLFVQIMHL